MAVVVVAVVVVVISMTVEVMVVAEVVTDDVSAGGLGLDGCMPVAPGSLTWHSKLVSPLPCVSVSLPPVPALIPHPLSGFPGAAAPVPGSGSALP